MISSRTMPLWILLLSIIASELPAQEVIVRLDKPTMLQGAPITGYFETDANVPGSFCDAIRFYGSMLDYILVGPNGHELVIDCKTINFCIDGASSGSRNCSPGLPVRVPIFLWFIDRRPLLDVPGSYRLVVRVRSGEEVYRGSSEFTVEAHRDYPLIRKSISTLYAPFCVQAFDAPVKVSPREFDGIGQVSAYHELVSIVVPFFLMSGLGVEYVLNYGEAETTEDYPTNAAEANLDSLRQIAGEYFVVDVYVDKFASARSGGQIPQSTGYQYFLSTH